MTSAPFAFAPALPLPLTTSRANASATTTLLPLRKPRPHPIRQTPKAVQQKAPPETEAPAPPTSPTWLLGYLKAMKERVDNALETTLVEESPNTHTILNAMRYSLLAGGKRIRPILAIAAFEMFAGQGTDLAAVMPTALSVEMLHTMSLIHDDLPSMDDDDFRRGKPTNHVVYGEDIAILAGDALLAYAFEIVARHSKGVDARRVVDVLALLTESVGAHGLVGGQVMDLQNEGCMDVTLDTLTWIHTHKTAALLRVSCACGAIMGGANDDDVKRVSEFAVKIGLAFQIADDVLDVTQSTEVLGKTAGKDEACEKATYPRLLGLDGSRKQAEKLIAEAKASLAPYGDRAKTLYAIADFIINRQN